MTKPLEETENAACHAHPARYLAGHIGDKGGLMNPLEATEPGSAGAVA